MESRALDSLRGMPPAKAVPHWLSDAYDDANAAVAVFDPDGTRLYVNGEMETLAKALGHADITLADLTPEDRTGAAFVDFERFRAGRLERLRTRYAIRRKDGALYWTDLSARRLEAGPEQGSLLVLQMVDITTECEAKRNETLWETALEGGRQGVWDHDARRETVHYSRMWRRMRGIPEDEEVDGLRELWLARLHPEDRERISHLVDKQEAGEDGYDILEYRERHRDGHYVWILSRGRPIEWDENGTPVRTVGTDTDITRIKTIEAELALEKERLQVTLQSIADGVISTDRDGLINFINAAAEKMTGWSVDTALGQRIETVFDSRLESQSDEPAELVQQCLRRGHVVKASGYTLLKGRTGQSRYVREVASPVLDETGTINGAVIVFRDATQRRKLMRKLEYTASHDVLTDLDNRASFEDRLETSVRDVKAGNGPYALCLIDLDHFKAVNDRGGHSAGDAMLKEIARLIRSTCRKGDCVARLGGDEFAVILNDCSLKTARRIAQKTVRRIAALRLKWQDETFSVGASIGVTAIDGSIDSTMDLYRNADSACYAAKRNGRGCVVVFG